MNLEKEKTAMRAKLGRLLGRKNGFDFEIDLNAHPPKIDLTLEDLIAGFAAIIESAPDALATDPEALRASLGKLDVDLGRMREALWAGDEKP